MQRMRHLSSFGCDKHTTIARGNWIIISRSIYSPGLPYGNVIGKGKDRWKYLLSIFLTIYPVLAFLSGCVDVGLSRRPVTVNFTSHSGLLNPSFRSKYVMNEIVER